MKKDRNQAEKIRLLRESRLYIPNAVHIYIIGRVTRVTVKFNGVFCRTPNPTMAAEKWCTGAGSPARWSINTDRWEKERNIGTQQWREQLQRAIHSKHRIRELEKRRAEALETRCWRRILSWKWMDEIRNEDTCGIWKWRGLFEMPNGREEPEGRGTLWGTTGLRGISLDHHG
jgi:hypothetical protein